MSVAQQGFLIAEELTRIPSGYWVALTQDESSVVFSAPTLEQACSGAAERGVNDPLLLKTPDDWDLLVA